MVYCLALTESSFILKLYFSYPLLNDIFVKLLVYLNVGTVSAGDCNAKSLAQ